MSSTAFAPKRKDGSSRSPSARWGRAAIACLIGLVLLSDMDWTGGEESYVVSIKPAMPPDLAADTAVVPLTQVDIPAEPRAQAEPSNDAAAPAASTDTAPVAELPQRDASARIRELMPEPFTLRAGETILHAMNMRLAGARRHAADAVDYGRQKVLPKFISAYRSVLKHVALSALPSIQEYAVLTNAVIIGAASTYNPYRDGIEEGDAQTASGEPYDPAAWTAAIQIDLRGWFGGIRYGQRYRPVYALVESGDKQMIVKINDVGPLRPGRVIDLNERSMRYLDPFMRRGLVPDVKVTLLPGADWTPGPLGGEPLISFASAQ